jgi:hypothetical protein
VFGGGTGARPDQRSYGLHFEGKKYSIGAVGYHGWITPDGNPHSYPHEGSFYRSPQAAVAAAKKFHRFYGGAVA